MEKSEDLINITENKELKYMLIKEVEEFESIMVSLNKLDSYNKTIELILIMNSIDEIIEILRIILLNNSLSYDVKELLSKCLNSLKCNDRLLYKKALLDLKYFLGKNRN